MQKASIYRTFLDATPLDRVVRRLPPAIAALVERPLLPSTWVGEGVATGLYLAARDLCFASDQDFLDHFRDVNRALVSSPMYRILFALRSPELLVVGAAKRFAALHRGMSFEIEERARGRLRVVIGHPPRLLPALSARAYAVAFEVILEQSGAKDATSRVTELDLETTGFDLSWR